MSQWDNLLESFPALARQLEKFKPTITTLGIKVADQDELVSRFGEFFELGDQAHFGPVNEVRTIVTIRKSKSIKDQVRYVKILQRRPGRNDPLGLEHIDILLKGELDLEFLDKTLREAGVNSEVESNEVHAWVSIRYKDFEFKLVDHVVWQAALAEMKAVL